MVVIEQELLRIVLFLLHLALKVVVLLIRHIMCEAVLKGDVVLLESVVSQPGVHELDTGKEV